MGATGSLFSDRQTTRRDCRVHMRDGFRYDSPKPKGNQTARGSIHGGSWPSPESRKTGNRRMAQSDLSLRRVLLGQSSQMVMQPLALTQGGTRMRGGVPSPS